MKLVSSVLLTGIAMCALTPAAGADEPADVDARARAALAQMNAEERIQLLHGTMPLMIPSSKRPAGIALGAGYVPGIEHLGIPPQLASDASLGVSNLMNMRPGDVATALPSGLAMASTWDSSLIKEGGRMIGAEARAKGFNVMLVGGVNLVRDPRAGRNFEYLGEDPLLAGTLVAAQIAGVQSNNIIGTIKHFALNDQETGRSSASVEMPEAAMRESDLLAFEIGIEKGNPGSVMCSYNQVGGVYACENSFLLNQVLRRDWGYKGYVMSDWGAVHSTQALVAGLDQQSGEVLDKKRWFSIELKAALADGRVPQSAVDTAALRILRSMYAHGVVDNPPATSAIDFDAHAKVALKAAEEGIVLLKNRDGILPLAGKARKIAVIGGEADAGVLSGGGSSAVVPVGGFAKTEKLGKEFGAAATFAQRTYGGTAPLAALKAAYPDAEITYVDGSDVAAATQLARDSDLAIVFGEKYFAEAVDAPDLSLDKNGDALIDAVTAANPNNVVVLEIGNPVVMPWRDKAGAILAAWYPGQRGGEAIARVLSGEVNPSGHLPVTFPASVAQLPNPVLPGSDLPVPSKEDRATYGINTNSPPFKITYPEGSDAGYRWFDLKQEKPLYAFGHGLSYTSFAYKGLGLKVKDGDQLTISFTVTNTGKRAGADVPQVYVKLPGKAKRLIGWDKPMLQPGQSTTVTVTADPRLLADFDTERQLWVVDPGKVTVEVGHSATETVLTGSATIGAKLIRP